MTDKISPKAQRKLLYKHFRAECKEHRGQYNCFLDDHADDLLYWTLFNKKRLFMFMMLSGRGYSYTIAFRNTKAMTKEDVILNLKEQGLL